MALSAAQKDQISRMLAVCKYIVETAKPQIDEFNYFFNGVPAWSSSIQQADLDAVPAYSGLTKQNLADIASALTGTLSTDIANALSNLREGAARG